MDRATIKNTITQDKISEADFNTKADAEVEQCGMSDLAIELYECANVARTQWKRLELQYA